MNFALWLQQSETNVVSVRQKMRRCRESEACIKEETHMKRIRWILAAAVTLALTLALFQGTAAADSSGTLAPKITLGDFYQNMRFSTNMSSIPKNMFFNDAVKGDKITLDDAEMMGTKPGMGMDKERNYVINHWKKSRYLCTVTADPSGIQFTSKSSLDCMEICRAAYVPFSVAIEVPAHTDRTCNLTFTVNYTNNKNTEVSTYAEIIPGGAPETFNTQNPTPGSILCLRSDQASGSATGSYTQTFTNDTDSPVTQTLNFVFFAGHESEGWTDADPEFTMTLDGSYTDIYTGDYPVKITTAYCTTDGPDKVKSGENYTATFTAQTGCTLPATVAVTMGSETLGSGKYTWDQGTGTLTIPNVSGALNITVSAVPDHGHPICGADCAHDNKHEEIVWLPWPDDNAPQSGGNYYLTKNVTLNDGDSVSITGRVNICLNGHVFNGKGSDGLFRVESGGTLNLCDCDKSRKGELTVDTDNSPVVMYGTGVLNLYNGTIRAEKSAIDTDTNGTASGGINIYGGIVASASNSDPGINAVNAADGFQIRVDGGEISGCYGIDLGSAATLTLSGSPSISGSTASLKLYTVPNTTVDDAKVDATGYTGETLTVVENGSLEACNNNAYAVKGGDGKFTLQNNQGCVYIYQTGGLKIHKHDYAYTLTKTATEDDTIVQSCRTCNHSATATLAAPDAPVYTGNPVDAVLTVSDNWMEIPPEASDIQYAPDNINAGTVTASLTKSDVTAQVTYAIAQATPTIPAPTVDVDKTTVSADGKAAVTLEPVTASSGGAVMYACSIDANVPSGSDGWQESTVFENLNEGTTYYFFAKAAETDNYLSAVSGASDPYTTPARFDVDVTLRKDDILWTDSDYTVDLRRDGEIKYTLAQSGDSTPSAKSFPALITYM